MKEVSITGKNWKAFYNSKGNYHVVDSVSRIGNDCLTINYYNMTTEQLDELIDILISYRREIDADILRRST